MDTYFTCHVKPLLGEQLLHFIEQLETDQTYIPDHHSECWNETRPRLVRLLRNIIGDLFKAYEPEDACAKRGKYLKTEPSSDSDTTDTNMTLTGPSVKADGMEAIEKLLHSIGRRLNTRFPTSPPFTIIHFVHTMVFLRNTIPPPLPEDQAFQYNGLKTYRKIMKNLVLETETETTVENPNYQPQQPPRHTKDAGLESDMDTTHDVDETIIEEQISGVWYSRNRVHALQYLRALLEIVSVESTIQQLQTDMQTYGSSYTIQNRNEQALGQKSGQTMVKMERIDWYDPSMLKPKTG